MRERRAAAMERDCPTCGAFPNQSCKGRDGPRIAPHRARYRAVSVGMVPTRDRSAELIDRLVTDAKTAAAEQIEHDYAWGSSMCESPIEKIFLAQFIHPHIAGEFDTIVNVMKPPSGLVEHTVPPPIPGIFLYPQIKIGDYRVDFLIHATIRDPVRTIIVECDGHDYHERTKAQAQRDKARDRFLMGKGYRVVRFTGSELFNNPFDCAYEAMLLLLDLAG